MHKFKLVKVFNTTNMDDDILKEIVNRCIITPLDCYVNTTVIVKYTVREDTVLDKWLLKHGAGILEVIEIEHNVKR